MHTGIDFPVSYGTTVMAATDGTVRTQWNSAYGNMADRDRQGRHGDLVLPPLQLPRPLR